MIRGTIVILFLILGWIYPTELASASGDCASCIADFAVYDPSYEDDGVWEEEVLALKAMFDRYGWTYRIIDGADINRGMLGVGNNRKFRALIAPGGYAYWRKLAVRSRGNHNIREFISTGGNFVGFCAGAYWASKIVRFAQAGRQYIDYPYDLKLFPSIAQGPLGWLPWNNGTNINLDIAAINLNCDTMSKIGMPPYTRFLYGGGPWFENLNSLPGSYEVWASAVAPKGTNPAQTDGNRKPTIIRFQYGQGEVILFSYHPDILIASMVDNVQLSQFYQERWINWNWGDQSSYDVNLSSWNIVHAAMQIAAGQPVTRLSSLP